MNWRRPTPIISGVPNKGTEELDKKFGATGNMNANNGATGTSPGANGGNAGNGGTNVTNGSTGSPFTQEYADSMLAQGDADAKAVGEAAATIDANNKTAYNETLGMIEANKNTQMEIANENTEFTIDQIEQQKAQAKKDYTREQSGAYVDYQKATSKHGANAEQMAANGLTNTGYSESSQVAMYNQYQQRIAVAREAYTQAITDYNNAITSARLQNNATLAEIAAQALEQRVSAILTFTQQSSDLLKWKTETEYAVKQTAHSNYMDVLKQIEDARRYDSSVAYQKEQDTKAEEEESEGVVPEGDGKAALLSLGTWGAQTYAELVEAGYEDALEWLWPYDQWKEDRSAGTGEVFMTYKEYVEAFLKALYGTSES